MDISTAPHADDRNEAFERVIADARRRPFEWGSHDCVTFAARCVESITGEDPLDGLPRWKDAGGAARAVNREGGLREALIGRFGDPLQPLMAQAGDIVLAVDLNDPVEREMLAVCVGPHLVAPGTAGLALMPLTAGRCAWRVRHG